jgi:NAD(P)-dependent dehydrogenase (short-subunit alcohol dehydrogenase family)
MPTVLITGANRGLGLEFARQYASEGWRVLATCREPDRAEALQAFAAQAVIHPLDVSDFDAVAALGRALADETIDVLIANAGVLLDDDSRPEAVDYDACMRSFRVNALAPLACANALLAQVARSSERKMIAIGSIVGSIGAATQGGYFAYRSSKAALNSVWRAFALDHPEVITAVLHPGRMRTDMTRYDTAAWNALASPQERAAQLRQVIASLEPKDTGGFFNYSGKSLPW